MKYKALALDLDGTLTNREKKVPVGNKEAIEKAIDAGVKVILASGRPLFGITPIARELELDKKGGYILAYNGGCIVDCKTGKQMSATIMPQDCIADICSLARANGVYALTYADTQIAAESDSDEYVKKEAICNSTTIKKEDDLRKFVDYPVEKFLVVGEHEKLLPVQKALLDKHEGVINAFFSESYFATAPFCVSVVIGEIIAVDALDEIGFLGRDAHTVFYHQLSELFAIHQNDMLCGRILFGFR